MIPNYIHQENELPHSRYEYKNACKYMYVYPMLKISLCKDALANTHLKCVIFVFYFVVDVSFTPVNQSYKQMRKLIFTSTTCYL